MSKLAQGIAGVALAIAAIATIATAPTVLAADPPTCETGPTGVTQCESQTETPATPATQEPTITVPQATPGGGSPTTPTTTASAGLPPGCTMVGATPATPGYSFVIPFGLRNANELPTTVTVPGTQGNPGTEQCANPQTPLATQPAPQATIQLAATTLAVQWQQQLQKGTIGYVPDKAPMLVGLPGCFWLNGASTNTQTTQTETSTFQGFSFSVKFRLTATLTQVDWNYGDGSQPSIGDAGMPWVYQQQQFCSNSHTYKAYTNPGQTFPVTATEEWSVKVDTWQTTSWGFQDTSWQPALNQATNLVTAPVQLTVQQEEPVLIPPQGSR